MRKQCNAFPLQDVKRLYPQTATSSAVDMEHTLVLENVAPEQSGVYCVQVRETVVPVAEVNE